MLTLLYLLPWITFSISLSFTVFLFSRWRKRPAAHTFWYGISALMFSAAVFAEGWGQTIGWTIPLYKMYYFFAIALVSYMAAGTLYLLFPKGWNHVYLVYTVATSVFFLWRIWGAAVNTAVLAEAGMNVGGDAWMDQSVRIFSIALSALGGALLLLGSLLSYWRSRLFGHLIITASVLVLSAGGRLSKMGIDWVLPASELVGISLLFLGVLGLQKQYEKQVQQKKLPLGLE
jgi:hypothetical protein